MRNLINKKQYEVKKIKTFSSSDYYLSHLTPI